MKLITNSNLQTLLQESNAEYYLDLCRKRGEELSAVVFLTHLSDGTGYDQQGNLNGHWVTTEHNFRKNTITIWDPLMGASSSKSLSQIDEQFQEQWVVANLLRTESNQASAVRLSIHSLPSTNKFIG